VNLEEGVAVIDLLERNFDRRDWQRIFEEVLVRSRVPVFGLCQRE
jgi:hypothetical protein